MSRTKQRPSYRVFGRGGLRTTNYTQAQAAAERRADKLQRAVWIYEDGIRHMLVHPARTTV